MKEKADFIVINGAIYTVDSSNNLIEAFAVKDGKILAVGSKEDISSRYQPADILDLQGMTVYPGFIDAHCHFVGYALGLQYVDLSGSASFEEVLQRINAHPAEEGKWIVGRGWDQNLWKEKKFPDNAILNARFPNTPVMLIRIDGHVVLANQAAMDAAGIHMQNSFGDGQVEVKSGKLTGILSETAADKLRSAVPEPAGANLLKLLKNAEQNCFAVGLTTVSDVGLNYNQVMMLDSLQKHGELSMFVYAILTPNQDNIQGLIRKGIFQSDRLVARSLKIYADGSLGSRTARLKMPYSDAPGESGIIVTSADSVKSLCKLASENGYQVLTHCIGDSAVHMILNIYGGFLSGKNDLRWRIEHAQVVDPADMHLFADFSVIPSVQATHATSDMYWAGDRLGPERIKGAYAYKSLMKQNGWIPNGTDFPIENISPLLTFYAAVARKDLKGFPDGGFEIENALSAEEALRSITIWAAKANFMEKTKGSIEVGKDADFVILDQDIMQMPITKVPEVHVVKTFILGKEVFVNKK